MSAGTEHTDTILVRELRKGNISAFNTLFYNYSSRLYHFGYSYLKSKEEAEELVQQVFTKIWEKRQEIKEEHQFKSYLFTIAFNQIKKYFRSKALLNSYVNQVDDVPVAHNPTSQEINYNSLRTLVDQLVDTMPEKRRQVFIKSRFEGKNSREISAEMNISQSTVENHLNQALNYLRKNLQKENIAGILFFFLFL